MRTCCMLSFFSCLFSRAPNFFLFNVLVVRCPKGNALKVKVEIKLRYFNVIQEPAFFASSSFSAILADPISNLQENILVREYSRSFQHAAKQGARLRKQSP